MTKSSQLEKDIKKINERRAEIARQVASGKLPQAALNRYDDAMRAAARDFIREGVTQRGATKGTPVLRIEHGKKALAEVDPNKIKMLLQRSTAGQIKKDIKRGASDEYGHAPTKEELEQYVTDLQYVDEALRTKYTETYDALDRKFRGTKGRKSYGELREAIEEYRKLTEKGEVETQQFDVDNVYFGGDNFATNDTNDNPFI